MSRYMKVLALVCGLILSGMLAACAAPVSSQSTAVQSALPPASTATISTPPLSPTHARVYTVAIPTPVPAPTLVPTAASASTDAVPVYGYKVITSYPHDQQAFTEGLEIEDGIFYEGTGLNQQSTLRKVELETGNVLQNTALPGQYFGEGVTVFGDRIFQLTWQSHVGFVYDKQTFQQVATFAYTTEGWGLTHDNTRLIMSDGTPTLHFLDPQTLQTIGQVTVTDASGPVTNINELEYIKGQVYANIWQTNRIARIDPQTGHVTAWIDLTGLLPSEDRQQPVDVLNGIAYDAANDRLFVTGKLWPKLFEIQLVPTP